MANRLPSAIVVGLIAPLLVLAQSGAGQASLGGTPVPLGEPVVRAAPVPAPPSATGEVFRSRVAGSGISGGVRAVFATPGDTLPLPALDGLGQGWRNGHRWIAVAAVPAGPQVLGDPAPEAALQAGGVVTPAGIGVWRLESASGDAVHVFNRIPASAQRGGYLNGYHLGVYPTAGSSRDDMYVPPNAFIEVNPESADLPVSDHLHLGQFLTHDQAEIWPKYVALDLRLIDKLELVVQELNAMGIRADRVYVMSGFRSPQYNGPGGDGRAGLSRHMWGDAADVWIDNDADEMMDDLNGDGQIDMDDAAVVMRAVERVERKHPDLVGGAGIYPTTPTHGPYIHIDARGYRARW